MVDTVAADQQFTATDNTGTGLGWHVTVSATTFTNGTHTLPDAGAVDFTGSLTSSLSTNKPSVTCVGSCTISVAAPIYPVVIPTAASSPTIYTTYDTPGSTGIDVMTIGGSTATNPIWMVGSSARLCLRGNVYDDRVARKNLGPMTGLAPAHDAADQRMAKPASV